MHYDAMMALFAERFGEFCPEHDSRHCHVCAMSYWIFVHRHG